MLALSRAQDAVSAAALPQSTPSLSLVPVNERIKTCFDRAVDYNYDLMLSCCTSVMFITPYNHVLAGMGYHDLGYCEKHKTIPCMVFFAVKPEAARLMLPIIRMARRQLSVWAADLMRPAAMTDLSVTFLTHIMTEQGARGAALAEFSDRGDCIATIAHWSLEIHKSEV